MATPSIKIDQSGRPPGTTGVSRSDLVTGVAVTVQDTANGAGSYTWELVVPPGSAATLNNPALAAPSFTPDVVGTYLVYCTFDGETSWTDSLDLASGVIAKLTTQGGAGVKHANGTRVPGTGETTQFSSVHGWAEDRYAQLTLFDSMLGALSGAQGAIPYENAAGDLAALAPGDAGQVLVSGGAGADPSWTDELVLGSGVGTPTYSPNVFINNAAADAELELMRDGGAEVLAYATVGSAGIGTVTDHVFALTSNDTVALQVYDDTGAGAMIVRTNDNNDKLQTAMLEVTGVGGAFTGQYLSMGSGSAAAVSAASTGRIRYNEGSNIFEKSENGGAWAALGGGGVTIGNAITGGTANRVLYEDASNQIAQSANLAFDGTTLSGPALTVSASPDVDSTHIFGRARIDSRTTDSVYFSHYDRTATTAYAMRQTPAGAVIVNGSAAGLVGFASDGSVKFYVDATNLYANDANGPAILNAPASASVPTLVPDRASISTGLGNDGTTGRVGMTIGGTRTWSFRTGTTYTYTNLVAGSPEGNYTLGSTSLGWGPFYQTVNSIGNTTADAGLSILAVNKTDAVADVGLDDGQQWSPLWILEGQGWKTDVTAASQEVQFAQQVKTHEGAAAPTGEWALFSNINDAGFVERFSVDSASNITAGVDTDLTAIFGYLRIDHRTTTDAYISHTSRTGAGDWGAMFDSSGATRLNARSGQVVELCNAGGAVMRIDSDSIRSVDANGPQMINRAATTLNPTLIPDRADNTTGIGATATGNIQIVAAGTSTAIFNSSSIRFAVSPTPTSDGSVDLGTETRGWGQFWNTVLAIGETTTDAGVGILSNNSTDAALGVQQYSPIFVLEGQGWKTDATAASQEVQFGQQVQPVQGAANPTGAWKLFSNINDAGFTEQFSVDSGGLVSAGADTDTPVAVFGRARIDSRATDTAFFSHYDMTAAGEYAIKQNSVGSTAVNVATGQALVLAVNGATQFAMDASGSGFRSADAGGPAMLNTAASVTIPTLIPDRADLTTGVGGAAANLSLIVSNTEVLDCTTTSLSSLPDTDATFIFGRSRFDSRTTDVAFFSHVDNTASSTYALRQSAARAHHRPHEPPPARLAGSPRC